MGRSRATNEDNRGHQFCLEKYHLSIRHPPCPDNQQWEAVRQHTFQQVLRRAWHEAFQLVPAHPQANEQIKAINKIIKLGLKTKRKRWRVVGPKTFRRCYGHTKPLLEGPRLRPRSTWLLDQKQLFLSKSTYQRWESKTLTREWMMKHFYSTSTSLKKNELSHSSTESSTKTIWLGITMLDWSLECSRQATSSSKRLCITWEHLSRTRKDHTKFVT